MNTDQIHETLRAVCTLAIQHARVAFNNDRALSLQDTVRYDFWNWLDTLHDDRLRPDDLPPFVQRDNDKRYTLNIEKPEDQYAIGDACARIALTIPRQPTAADVARARNYLVAVICVAYQNGDGGARVVDADP